MIGLVTGLATVSAAVALIGGRPLADSFPIVELRQYTLRDGQRDTLINLFEREFVESQEALGMKVIGTFRDVDRPNRFVWIRGFTDMDARLAGLSAFYGGPVWQMHRSEANATMIDSDNVLLLHAPVSTAAFEPQPSRPVVGEKRRAGRMIATIYYLNSDVTWAEQRFELDLAPKLRAAGVPILAWFTTEAAANNYPKLPVREGERVLVWFAGFGSDADYNGHKLAIENAATEFAPDMARSPEVLRLEPTQRSELR